MKKIIALAVMSVMTALIFAGCGSGGTGKKPEGFDDPMPELWEEVLSGKAFDLSVVNENTTEITIGADITDIDLDKLWRMKNIENIYVEAGNPMFVSEDGVLYSKSYQTLYRWPSKKPVTAPKETIKYFIPQCYYECDMPEDFDIPDGTITIGGGAFRNTNLTKLHIKSNVKSVGSWGYRISTTDPKYSVIYTESCKLVEISAPIVYASFYIADRYGDTCVETIIFNEGVKQIRKMGFSKKAREHMTQLNHTKYITFPSTLEAIGNVSFPVNVNVVSYTLPENIVYLGKYAFDDYYVKSRHPLHIPREVLTEFTYSGQIAEEYIAKNMPQWEKNKEKLGYDVPERGRN